MVKMLPKESAICGLAMTEKEPKIPDVKPSLWASLSVVQLVTRSSP
jgi:hypothetical protein